MTLGIKQGPQIFGKLVNVEVARKKQGWADPARKDMISLIFIRKPCFHYDVFIEENEFDFR